MKRMITMAVLMMVASGLSAETADELLARIDAQRSIPDMSFVMEVRSYDGDAQTDSNTLWGFVKFGTGPSKCVMDFVAPASVKGRKMLMDGNVVYLLFPKTRNPIRLSPLQILMGEASNGDVARTGFSRDYEVASLTEEIRDGVACDVFHLSVKQSMKDASYKQVTLWVDKSTLRPISAEFYASADKLLKRAFYKDYADVQGKDVPMVMDIYDAENPQKHTVLAYKKIGTRAVPVTVFSRDYLVAWAPEEP